MDTYTEFFQNNRYAYTSQALLQDRLKQFPEDATKIQEAFQIVFGEEYLPQNNSEPLLNEPCFTENNETSHPDESVETWVDQVISEANIQSGPTYDLPAEKRRQAIVDFMVQSGYADQQRNQIEIGAGYMLPGVKLPKEEYTKVVDRIRGDLRLLKDAGTLQETIIGKRHLYSLSSRKTTTETPGEGSSTTISEVQQLFKEGMETTDREEQLQIVAKILVRLTGVI